MFNFIFGSKYNINEKTLEQNGVKLLSKNDLKMDKNNIIATTGSGKFYKGIYKNDAVSIKIIDITKEEQILNEFIYWQEYKNNDSFLNFIGAFISGTEAYLIFEFFAYTLDQVLTTKLGDESKIKITKQTLKIIENLQIHHKVTRDFRPGVLGINSNLQVKLLDFGFLISDKKLINQDIIDKHRLKYAAPEALLFLTEDIAHDIWSFGCILIDIYSKEQPIYKQTLSFDELYKLHTMDSFPIIPNDINILLRDIISKCLERNYVNRIKISELTENLNILLDNLARTESLAIYSNVGITRNEDDKIITGENFSTSNKHLQETHDFIDQLETKLNKVNNLIINEQMDKTSDLKNHSEYGHDEAVRRLSENYTLIKENLSEISLFKVEILDKIKEKILANILLLQQYYGTAMGDIIDAQNIISDMKINVNSLSKMKQLEKYTNVLDSLTKNRNILEQHVSNYSEEYEYDKILKLYNENQELVEMFRTLLNNKELVMTDILESIQKHRDAFVKNSNIKQIIKKLKIENIQLNEDSFKSNSKNISEIYAKVQENSNIIIIYDIEKKKFSHIKIDNKVFNAKLFSFYTMKTIYVSGGIISDNKTKNKTYSKLFYKIKVNIDYDQFTFEIDELNDMLNSRAGHTMIDFNEYLIAIGGLNTKTCEIYAQTHNKWESLPDLPTLCLNPSVCVINNILFVFAGSGSINSFDNIYQLPLNNINKILSSSNDQYKGVLNWIKIDYYFQLDSLGRLRRGMACLGRFNTREARILLFGGFDYDNIYDGIYEFNIENTDCENIKSQNVDRNKMMIDEFIPNTKREQDTYQEIHDEDFSLAIRDTNMILPVKTFFNSNLLLFEDYLIMIDGYNNAIELNLNSNEFFYYT